MASVNLRNGESQDSLLKRFRKKVVKSGVLSTVRRKRWFVSKSEQRRMEKPNDPSGVRRMVEVWLREARFALAAYANNCARPTALIVRRKIAMRTSTRLKPAALVLERVARMPGCEMQLRFQKQRCPRRCGNQASGSRLTAPGFNSCELA